MHVRLFPTDTLHVSAQKSHLQGAELQNTNTYPKRKFKVRTRTGHEYPVGE